MIDFSFDTSTLSLIYRFYFKDRFPSFWIRFNELVSSGRAGSVSEVEEELSRGLGLISAVQDLKQLNNNFFAQPSSAEQSFVAGIFAVPHFRNLLSARAIATGTPVADPFVIAKAAIMGMCVVTEEKDSPNAAKIPNVCNYFNIECINLQQLMVREGWQF